jgi:hypothetical protein
MLKQQEIAVSLLLEISEEGKNKNQQFGQELPFVIIDI